MDTDFGLLELNYFTTAYGHQDSQGTTFYIPQLFKNLSKSCLSKLFLGFFLVIPEVDSQIFIASLAIFKI